MKSEEKAEVVALAHDMVRREVMEPMTEFMDRLIGVLILEPGVYAKIASQMLQAWRLTPEDRRDTWGDQMFARYASLNHDLSKERRSVSAPQLANIQRRPDAQILELAPARREDHQS